MEYNTEKKWYEKKWMLIAAILIGIILIPIITYSLKFYDHGFSKNPEDWALFGDYIGGTTNLILGTLNITATIVLAFIIKNLDDKRNEIKDIQESDKHRENLKLNIELNLQNLQFSEYKNFVEIYLGFADNLIECKDNTELRIMLNKCFTKTLFFLKCQTSIFPTLDKNNKLLYHNVEKAYELMYKEINIKINNNNEVIFINLEGWDSFRKSMDAIQYALLKDIKEAFK